MKPAYRTIAALLFVLYGFVLLKVTLFRTSVTLFDVEFGENNGYITSLATAWQRANFIPFHSVWYYLISQQEPIEVGLVNVFGNILLFIPFGVLLPLVWRKARRFGNTVGIIAGTSLLFEVLQMLLAIGNFDIDDVLLNTVGGMLGYALFALGVRISSSKARRLL